MTARAEIPPTFGALLKAARLSAGISPPQLAAACGWSKKQVHEIERQPSITEKTVRRYLRGLGLEPVLGTRAAETLGILA